MYPVNLSDAVSVMQKFELNNPRSNKEKDPQHHQKDRSKDKGQDTKHKSKDPEENPREGVSLFQQGNEDNASGEHGEDTVTESEVQLLQRVVMDDDDDRMHFLFTQTDSSPKCVPKDDQLLLTQPDKYANISRS